MTGSVPRSNGSKTNWNESILNPVEEFVKGLRRKIKDNNGYCLYAMNHNNKADKCPKGCHKQADECDCGMYVRSYFDEPLWDN